jgi:hypothetical protein
MEDPRGLRSVPTFAGVGRSVSCGRHFGRLDVPAFEITKKVRCLTLDAYRSRQRDLRVRTKIDGRAAVDAFGTDA